MTGVTSAGATDADTDDPFSDRKHGPRTRSRANKEDVESARKTPSKRGAKFRTPEPKQDPSPSHKSFAKLPPAAFPSLDTGLPVTVHEQIRRQREIEEAADRLNPFANNDGLYFGSQGDSAGLKALLTGAQKEQGNSVDSKGTSSCGTSQEHRTKAEQSGKESLQRHGFKAPTAEKPSLYRSTLTHNSVSGTLVRWHRRAKSDDSPTRPGIRKTVPKGEYYDFKGEDDLGAYRPSDFKMAENVAPTVGSGDDSTRGMPYYERLKKILKTSIKQKQDLEETLAKIEQSIWNKEAAYLDETIAGNIMKGFDNYIKASGAQGGSTSGGGTASRKKATVSEQDRLFSRSSVGFWSSMREGSPHASNTSTPSHAPTPKGLSDNPTPTSTTSTKMPSLKKKRPDDDTDGKPPNKRLKITFSRNEKD